MFMVLNFGVLGVDDGVLVINYFEVVILGLGVIKLCLVVVGGEVVVWLMMMLICVFDYCVVDGVQVVQFMCELWDLIELLEIVLLDLQLGGLVVLVRGWLVVLLVFWGVVG